MIRKTLNGGLHTLVGIAAAMLAVSVVLTTVNALARSFFHMNFPWVEELCCYLAALMMFVMMPFFVLMSLTRMANLRLRSMK